MVLSHKSTGHAWRAPDGERVSGGTADERELFLAIAESGPDVVTVIAPDGTILRTFRGRDALFGFEPGEVDRRNLREFVHPDDAVDLEDCLVRMVEPGASASRVLRLRNKQGAYMELECMMRSLVHNPAVAGVIVYSRDVSERMALERRLRLAERMEIVGRMASGIAHDFNNILAVIELSASRALARRGAMEQQLVQIQRAAARASGLTKRLLSFARDRSMPRTAVNLCRLLREMSDMLSSLLPECVSLRVHTPEGARYVLADPAQVEQVILNLVFNARDALTRGGSIDISLRDVEQAGQDVAPQVVLAVRDDGTGMDESTRTLALEPFFTTKEAGIGTGLGLWTVRDFAVRSGGSVDLKSAPGQGTLCEVILPTVDRQGRYRSLTPLPVAPPVRGATVLLVEDEPALRQTVAELLSDVGHRVFTARDGLEALELAQELTEPIGALITDVVMPRLGGVALASALRARSPELAVLFVTGYGDTADIPELPRTALLRKPFPAQALVGSLGRLLATGSASSSG